MLVELIEPDPSNLVLSYVRLVNMTGLPGERRFHYKVEMEFDAVATLESDSINLNLVASLQPPPHAR